MAKGATASADAANVFTTRVRSTLHRRAIQLRSHLSRHHTSITPAAAELLNQQLTAVPASVVSHPTISQVATLVRLGLVLVKRHKIPQLAAITAAERLGLRFANFPSEGNQLNIRLGTTDEITELAQARKCFQLVDLREVAKRDEVVRSFVESAEAVGALLEQNPRFLEDRNVRWSTRDPYAGDHAVRNAYEETGSAKPDAYLPGARTKVVAASSVFAPGEAAGSAVGFPALVTEQDWSRSDVPQMVITGGGRGIPQGAQVEGALNILGFVKAPRRRVVRVFPPIPAPAKGAKKFVPRGHIDLYLGEPGLWQIVTIVEGKVVQNGLVVEGDQAFPVTGGLHYIGGRREYAALSFESVATMGRRKEEVTRGPHRGHIIVIAVPVVEKVDLSETITRYYLDLITTQGKSGSGGKPKADAPKFSLPFLDAPAQSGQNAPEGSGGAGTAKKDVDVAALVEAFKEASGSSPPVRERADGGSAGGGGKGGWDGAPTRDVILCGGPRSRDSGSDGEPNMFMPPSTPRTPTAPPRPPRRPTPPSEPPVATVSSTRVEEDRKTSSGMSSGKKIRVVPDKERSPLVIVIDPLAIAPGETAATAQEVRDNVVSILGAG